MKNSHDVVKGLLRTEKGSVLHTEGKYLFWVDSAANKIEIKRSVEDIYKVKVASVNTMVMRGKLRRVRYAEGKTPDWKKAVVTLKEGNKIDVV
jgi:large subunit ribosomal protein L23